MIYLQVLYNADIHLSNEVGKHLKVSPSSVVSLESIRIPSRVFFVVLVASLAAVFLLIRLLVFAVTSVTW